MSTVVVAVLLAIAVVLTAVLVLLVLDEVSDRQSMRERFDDANADLQAEFHNARRQMNDAAGQSWRNLVE